MQPPILKVNNVHKIIQLIVTMKCLKFLQLHKNKLSLYKSQKNKKSYIVLKNIENSIKQNSIFVVIFSLLTFNEMSKGEEVDCNIDKRATKCKYMIHVPIEYIRKFNKFSLTHSRLYLFISLTHLFYIHVQLSVSIKCIHTF